MSNLLLRANKSTYFSHWLLPIEFAVLALTTFFFWYPTPNPNSPPEFDRADWLWLLALVPLLMVARFIVRRRVWTRTLYDGWFVAFLVLGILNVQFAPYESRGVMMLARPVLGIVWVYYLVELARETRSLRWPLILMTALGLFIGVVALVSTQWVDKSADFVFIIRLLPKVNPFFATGGFNPNEIAGAMAWFIPLAGSLVFYPWERGLKWMAVLAFSTLLLALMLGQSRAAILGVIPALIVLVLLWVRRPRNRYLALLGIGFLIVVQWAVLVNVFPAIGVGTDDATPEALGLSRRDERTTGQRFDIWRSAFDMIADYPLTGVGMARFRYRPVRNDYPVPEFDYPANPEDTIFRRRLIPHAHNVLVQIATDLGIPGLIVFIGWNTAAAYMVVMVWQRGDRPQKIVVTGVSLGLLAQLVYSMGDAIPLWDRFSFIYWLLLGIIAAQYRLIQAQQID